MKENFTRREATRLIGASAAGLLLPVRASRAETKSESSTMLTRPIPSSGEKLPVIGLGTWQKFDVDLTSDSRRQLGDVLSLFMKLGGRVIDTSPMYGRAEEVIGDLTATLGIRRQAFSLPRRFGPEARKTEFGRWNAQWSDCEPNKSI